MKFNIGDRVTVPSIDNYGYLAGHEFSARIIDFVNRDYLVQDSDDDVFTVSETEIEMEEN